MAGKEFTDTTDFYAIDHGDRIQVEDRWYKVLGHENERRFGMEDLVPAFESIQLLH